MNSGLLWSLGVLEILEDRYPNMFILFHSSLLIICVKTLTSIILHIIHTASVWDWQLHVLIYNKAMEEPFFGSLKNLSIIRSKMTQFSLYKVWNEKFPWMLMVLYWTLLLMLHYWNIFLNVLFTEQIMIETLILLYALILYTCVTMTVTKVNIEDIQNVLHRMHSSNLINWHKLLYLSKEQSMLKNDHRAQLMGTRGRWLDDTFLHISIADWTIFCES